jgi:hypothetical protein
MLDAMEIVQKNPTLERCCRLKNFIDHLLYNKNVRPVDYGVYYWRNKKEMSKNS